jgi:hypothetical protein
MTGTIGSNNKIMLQKIPYHLFIQTKKAMQMSKLPYKVTTANGKIYLVDFELHPETASAVHVNHLLTAVLDALDNEIGVLGDAATGDVLQALAMALATRTRIVPNQSTALDESVLALVENSLDAKFDSDGDTAPPGVSVH